MNVSTVDLRCRTKDILRAVERGESFTVLHRGKEKARIVPPLTSHDAHDLRTPKLLGSGRTAKISAKSVRTCASWDALVIFNTDVLWFFRGDGRAADLIASQTSREMSIVSLMELFQGARAGSELKVIRRFVQQNGLRVLPLTEPISHRQPP